MNPAGPPSLRLALTATASALAGLLVLAGVLADGARAETMAAFDVQASIVPGCSVDGLGVTGHAGPVGVLDFGVDSALSVAVRTADLTGSQAVRLRCTPGVALSISIDGGQHAASGLRHLQSGADPSRRLQYRLYRDPGFAAEIGIGAPHSVLIDPAMADDVRLPLFARVVLPGDRPPGRYDDTLLMTLSW